MARVSTSLPDYRLPDEELLRRCDASSSSTHGPGGQHRNKAESAVRLRHRATGLVVQCEEHAQRSQNRTQALARLRLRLALHDPTPIDPAVLAPHRDGLRLRIAMDAPDLPAVAALCVQALGRAQGRVAEAAQALGVSTAQLTKVMALDKEIRAAADAIRRQAGLGPLSVAHHP